MIPKETTKSFEESAAFLAYTEKLYTVRGMIIHEAVFMERMIDLILSNHFSKDPETFLEMRDWVFTERIPLEPKIQTLKLVFEKHKKQFVKDNPEFFNNLIHIAEQRNIFAHYLVINDEEHVKKFNLTGEITFAKFKTNSKLVPYTTDMVKKVVNMMLERIPALVEFAGNTPPSQDIPARANIPINKEGTA
jgi:hypothetical protein